jgi:Rod binding domain-containing protein
MNNNSVFQSNNNTLLKRNSSMSIPKSKKDFMRKEILKGSATYLNYNLNNQNQRQNNPNINMNKHKKQHSSIFMSSTIYSKKKPNSSQGTIINNKRLASSRSMYNLKSNSNLIRERGISIFNIISKQKSNITKLDRNSKNNGIINRNIPFMNFTLTKKKGSALDNDIYNASSGKMINGSDKKYKENNFNLNYDFFTDRMRNKNIRNHDIKVNYNNKSGNNIFYN